MSNVGEYVKALNHDREHQGTFMPDLTKKQEEFLRLKSEKNNMPKLLENKLKKEYPNNPHAVFGTLNKIGAMRGSKETKKGRAIEKAMEKHNK